MSLKEREEESMYVWCEVCGVCVGEGVCVCVCVCLLGHQEIKYNRHSMRCFPVAHHNFSFCRNGPNTQANPLKGHIFMHK